MTRRRLYCRPLPSAGGEVQLEPEERKHARVLRLQDGDEVELFDGQGGVAKAYLSGEASFARFEAKAAQQCPPLQPELVLVQALIKPAKLEVAVRMATEIGAAEIVLVETERSLSSAESRNAFKPERLTRVVRDAVRQSERCYQPTVHPPVSWTTWVGSLPVEAGGWILSARKDPNREDAEWNHGGSYVVVGPEGGFSEAELEGAREAGLREVGLGLPILRAETAAAVAVALARHAGVGDHGPPAGER